MTDRVRIYLDHAATSWPKCDSVLNVMHGFARQNGAAAGRGGYGSATESDSVIARARRTIARLIAAERPDCISLHSNGTAALNAAIHGVVRDGDHVVTCAAEHNSVLRPLHYLQQHRNVQLTIVPTNKDGTIDADELIRSVSEQTRLVALTHASNVTGAVQPIETVGQAMQQQPAIFLVDAAQTFGTLPIDVSAAGIDMLAAPGHKASGGPLGTAFLYVAEAIHGELRPSVQGGTGSQSESLEMPTAMPFILEAGNLNVPAIAGWNAALGNLEDEPEFATRTQQTASLARRLHSGLAGIDQLRVFGSAGELPIASVAVPGLSPSDTATVLDVEYGIETRAGLHCAALIHRYLGSEDEGTLRISGGHTTTDEEIDRVVEALRDIVVKLS